jgi:hypothetical protein
MAACESEGGSRTVVLAVTELSPTAITQGFAPPETTDTHKSARTETFRSLAARDLLPFCGEGRIMPNPGGLIRERVELCMMGNPIDIFGDSCDGKSDMFFSLKPF